jgi:alcohol dehydrogenase (cytochrome c)
MRKTRLIVTGAVATAAAAFLAPSARAQEQVETVTKKTQQPVTFTDVTDAMLMNARNDGGKNWLMYGRDYSNQRWSPLNQINTGNVQNLRVAWMYQTGISRLGSFETSPVVVDGVMYLTTPYNTAMAVDARTGKELWRYEHKLGTQIFCCGPNNRGIGISGGTVYMLTLDARLVALDAKTGKVKFDVEIADPEAGFSETHAPIIVGDKILVGISGGEYGIRGFVRAYNKENGQQLWNTYTVFGPGEGPNGTGWEGEFKEKTWEGDYSLNRNIAQEKAALAKYADAYQRGGAGVWTNAAYDDELKLLYVATGNPSPDLDGSVRPGDNLCSDCIVAMDVNTGKIKWYYQEVPHDVWDLDATSPPIVVKLKDGKKAVAQAGKTAWVYVLDAQTGKLIRKTQNFNRLENMFAQPTPEGTRMLPGANGGSEWSPMSYNPNLGFAYVMGLEQPMHYITHNAPYEKGKLWLGSAFKAIPGEQQYGTFTALDLNTGKVAWQEKVEQPMIGGSLATAGNLVFTGEGNGTFRAFDARNGKSLWSFQAGAGCNAPPVTYSLDGTQYIAVACGGTFQLGYPLGDAVLVFSLPGARGAARSGTTR